MERFFRDVSKAVGQIVAGINRWMESFATPEVLERLFALELRNLGMEEELEERWKRVEDDFANGSTLLDAVNKAIREAQEEAHKNWWADYTWNH